MALSHPQQYQVRTNPRSGFAIIHLRAPSTQRASHRCTQVCVWIGYRRTDLKPITS